MLVDIIHRQHQELREMFLQHQEALLQGQFNQAMKSLVRFHEYLSVHMTLEEQHLFSIFAEIERQSRWDADLYDMEHGKIRKQYDAVVKGLTWLKEQKLSPSDQRRNIIALLDREKTFKGLLEHHEDREEDAMLRELDEQLPRKQRVKLEKLMEEGWGKK